jgi:hypothetical protein
MLNANHPLLKINPVIQFISILTIVVVAVLVSKTNLYHNSNDWNVVCFGLLFYIIINVVLGIFQYKVLQYLGLSLLVYVALIFSFLFMGKFGFIDSIRTTTSHKLVILASTVFYVVLTVISQLIRLLYTQTQKL